MPKRANGGGRSGGYLSCPHCSSRTAPARPAVEIFGLFLRREADTGTDLGLTIAKTFRDAHGQRIWVDNVPRGGATFCFALGIATDLPEEH